MVSITAMDDLEFNDSVSESFQSLLIALEQVQEARKNLYNRHGDNTVDSIDNINFNVGNAVSVVRDSCHHREFVNVEKFIEHLRTINLEHHQKVAKMLAKPLDSDIAKLHESLKGRRPIEEVVSGWMDLPADAVLAVSQAPQLSKILLSWNKINDKLKKSNASIDEVRKHYIGVQSYGKDFEIVANVLDIGTVGADLKKQRATIYSFLARGMIMSVTSAESAGGGMTYVDAYKWLTQEGYPFEACPEEIVKVLQDNGIASPASPLEIANDCIEEIVNDCIKIVSPASHVELQESKTGGGSEELLAVPKSWSESPVKIIQP